MLRRQILKLAALAALPWPAAATVAAAGAPEFALFGRIHLFAVHRFQYCAARNFQVVLKLRSPLAGRPLPFTPKRPLAHLRVPGLALRELAPRAGKRLPELAGEWLDPVDMALPSRFDIMDTLLFAHIESDQRQALPAQYFAFGGTGESYALRRIGGAPDLEHLVRLKSGAREFLPEGTSADRAGLARLVQRRDQLLLSALDGSC